MLFMYLLLPLPPSWSQGAEIWFQGVSIWRLDLECACIVYVGGWLISARRKWVLWLNRFSALVLQGSAMAVISFLSLKWMRNKWNINRRGSASLFWDFVDLLRYSTYSTNCKQNKWGFPCYYLRWCDFDRSFYL